MTQTGLEAKRTGNQLLDSYICMQEQKVCGDIKQSNVTNYTGDSECFELPASTQDCV